MVIRRERGKMRADPQSMTTRPSAVAGLFYDDDPDRLRTQVLDLLADVESRPRSETSGAPHVAAHRPQDGQLPERGQPQAAAKACTWGRAGAPRASSSR